MWVLLWGDNANKVSGEWNHEDHTGSEAALKSAETKLHMGLKVHAILKPSGEQWMSASELDAELRPEE